jgi:hypothetical protein
MSAAWMQFKRLYGLQKPFDFRVATPFLMSLLLLIAVLAACAALSIGGNLLFRSERFYFFAYVATLLVFAATLSRFTAISLVIALWCTLELGLASASGAFLSYGLGGASSLLPRNVVPQPGWASSRYHPLLGFSLIPNVQRQVRFDDNNRDAFKDWLINWAALDGKTITISHNSLGLRSRELTAGDLSKDLIFVYGGSTTYDPMVTDGETWVERLQSELDNRFTIVNLGISTHSTTEHLIHTAFYQSVVGKKPVCALYYIGWNDILNAHIANLDPAYANYHALRIAARRPEIWGAQYSPVMRLASRLARARFDSIPEPPQVYGGAPVSGSDARLERFFAEHVTTITAINRSRGIRTVFIGQILNRDILGLRPSEVSYLFPLTRNEDVWPLQEHFNSILRSTAVSVGAGYIDAGVEKFHYNDFADWGHFVSTGSRKFATAIANDVRDYCQ